MNIKSFISVSLKKLSILILVQLLLFSITSFLNVPRVNAQCAFPVEGCFSCSWSGAIGICRPINNCNSEYEPDPSTCGPLNYSQCGASQNLRCRAIPINPYAWGDDPTCDGGTGINTAIGCLPVNDLNEFAKFLLGWGIGIAGGAALILIIVASFQIITSSGDPKRMQAGRELLTSAIAGLVLLIFSVLILDIIGIRLLNIPGFG